MNLKYNEVKNIMHKKFFQIITALAIAGAGCPVAAMDTYGEMDLDGRSQVVRAQLSMQAELNQLTGQNHSTLVKAINSATDEQCNQVAHSGSGGREALLGFNSHANSAKHDLSHYDFVNNPWDNDD